MSEPVKSVSALRHNLKQATEAYERVKTYANSLWVQNAQRALQTFFVAERKVLTLIEGDNQPGSPELEAAAKVNRMKLFVVKNG